MTRDNQTKVSKREQAKRSKKNEDKNLKRKKIADSDSDENDEDYTTENENDELDVHEYRKFLKKIFPSKYLDKKIKEGEKNKKSKKDESESEEEEEDESEEEKPKKSKSKSKNDKSNSKSKRSKKIESESEEEEEEEWETESEQDEKLNKKKKSRRRVVASESEDDDDEITLGSQDTEEDDEEEDEYEISKKSPGKVNIIFTIGGAEDDDEYDEDYDSAEDYEDYEDSDNATEDEDESVSTSASSDDDEDDDDEDDEEPVTKKGKKSSKTVAKKETKADKKENKKMLDKVQEVLDEVSVKENNSDSNNEILTKLKELYETNKNNKLVKKCLDVCEEDIKKNKKKQEKKEKKHKAKNLRIFRKIIRDKNTMNDFSFYEKLEIPEQKKIIKELREINKITRIEKPYRMTLLESTIPVEFKAAAMKKINSLRYMEPGSGEFYKIKNWVDTFMRIPFTEFQGLPINISDGVEKCHEFMENAQKTLDTAVYGLDDAKMQIMQMLGQLVTNPKAIGAAIAIHGPPGTGKCMVKDTPILMYDGSIKMVQDVKIGDLLMGDDSTPRTVLSLGSGKDNLYDIVPTKGEKYGVNSEHILCLKPSGINRIRRLKNKDNSTSFKVEYFNKNTFTINSKRFDNIDDANDYLNIKSSENDIIEIPVKTLLKLPKYISEKLKGYSVGVNFPSKQVPFEPYIVGVWLGDGDSSTSRITNQDSKVLHYLRNKLAEYNLNLTYNSGYSYRIGYDLHRKDNDSRNNKNIFLQILKDFNLLNNKHIPDIYKINDRNTQLELLAGLIDTDGNYSNKDKCYYITQKNKILSDDILFVCRSLGFSAYQKEIKSACTYKGERKEGIYYTITISGNNLYEIPVKIIRKKVTEQRLQCKNTNVTGIKIISKGYGDYYGFELDCNHRYLLGNFTVTHNTSLVKEGISKILNRPFAFIALGGATDSSFLEGHSYTYEGSTWGKIVQILIDSKCMNPVIYFDELDKISDTPRGEEIAGILTHLTDTTQNSQFHDKYFAEINFDLSKCLFIFSYNDETKVNPILKDRMYRIKTKGYVQKEKTIIAKSYLLPRIREQVRFESEEIIIPDDTIHYMIENLCDKEDGVRNLKRCLEIIFTKLNLYRLMKPGSNLFEENMSLKVEFPFTVTKNLVDKLIKKEKENMSALYSMYV